MRKKIVAGNWKMNLDYHEGLSLFSEIINMINDEVTGRQEAVICSPFIHIHSLAHLAKHYSKVSLGAQNAHQAESGAYTGEVSAKMIKSAGAAYVILGHSERRQYFGESRDSPWSLGICGGFASPRAARIMGDADAIVAFGASLNDFTLHGGRLLDPGATLVQVDLDAAPTVSRVDLYVTGDAAQVAGVLLEGVHARGLTASSWRDEVASDIGLTGWEHEPYDDASTTSRIDPRSLSLALARLLPAKRTLVMDGGHFVGWPAMYWPSADPSALVFTGAAFQTIGLGFAGAVGAAVGRTDRTTVVALGDGGALMGLPELETLIRVSRSALVVIFNDAAYGAEVHMYRPLVTDTSPAAFGDTDFAAVARAFGARSATVRTVADLAGLRAWRAAGCHGTYLLDCKVAPDVVAKYLSDLGGRIRAGGA